MKQTFQNIRKIPDIKISEKHHSSAAITPWPQNRPGAISLAFTAKPSYVYQYLHPEMKDYGLRGTLGVDVTRSVNVPMADEKFNLHNEFIDWQKIIEMIDEGWEFAPLIKDYQSQNKTDLISSKEYEIINRHIEQEIFSLIYPNANAEITLQQKKFNRKFFTCINGNNYNTANGDPFKLHSFEILNNNLSNSEIILKVLENGKNKWTILNYSSDSFLSWKISGINRNMFQRHIRIVRNSGYYIDTIDRIGKYRLTYQHSSTDLKELKI